MHTVRWVARHLGLAPGTLRAWEARYGIVHPARSESGYRLYDDHDLEALQAMTDLVAAGMAPAQAAEQIRSGRVAPPPEAARTSDTPAGLPDPAALITASRGYDARTLEDTLDAAFAAARFEHVIDAWLMPAMVAVGQAWAGGHLDVAQEHFLSAAVMRRLAAAYDAAGHARAGTPRPDRTGPRRHPPDRHPRLRDHAATGRPARHLPRPRPARPKLGPGRAHHPPRRHRDRRPHNRTTPQPPPTSSTPCTRHPNTPPSTSAAPAHHPNKPPAAPPSPGPPTGSPTPSPPPPPHPQLSDDPAPKRQGTPPLPRSARSSDGRPRWLLALVPAT